MKDKREKAAPAAVRPASGSAAGGIDFDAVRELARIASEFDLVEVEADRAGRVRVRRGGDALPAAPSLASHRPTIALAPTPPPPADVSVGEPGTFVASPFVGTFYRASSPEAAPFIEVGQPVRKGQVVCIVEAMKLMNEIEAEIDGRVVEILAKNGDHVEYGQNLFRIAKG